eukprot:TRINITY_DN2414_c2_g1_i1.p1 TRINITY_DN2414_c2_g1~~TRINITY_DN2414_c2_g1_i1.p1  ORF type:complete len:633 (+),score=127.71 TRINITY_DN2414_c2_g1_i1:49-1899(+)
MASQSCPSDVTLLGASTGPAINGSQSPGTRRPYGLTLPAGACPSFEAHRVYPERCLRCNQDRSQHNQSTSSSAPSSPTSTKPTAHAHAAVNSSSSNNNNGTLPRSPSGGRPMPPAIPSPNRSIRVSGLTNNNIITHNGPQVAGRQGMASYESHSSTPTPGVAVDDTAIPDQGGIGRKLSRGSGAATVAGVRTASVAPRSSVMGAFAPTPPATPSPSHPPPPLTPTPPTLSKHVKTASRDYTAWPDYPAQDANTQQQPQQPQPQPQQQQPQQQQPPQQRTSFYGQATPVQQAQTLRSPTPPVVPQRNVRPDLSSSLRAGVPHLSLETLNNSNTSTNTINSSISTSDNTTTPPSSGRRASATIPPSDGVPDISPRSPVTPRDTPPSSSSPAASSPSTEPLTKGAKLKHALFGRKVKASGPASPSNANATGTSITANTAMGERSASSTSIPTTPRTDPKTPRGAVDKELDSVQLTPRVEPKTPRLVDKEVDVTQLHVARSTDNASPRAEKKLGRSPRGHSRTKSTSYSGIVDNKISRTPSSPALEEYTKDRVKSRRASKDLQEPEKTDQIDNTKAEGDKTKVTERIGSIRGKQRENKIPSRKETDSELPLVADSILSLP